MDDAHHGRGHFTVGRRHRRVAAQPEQTLSPGRGIRHPDFHPADWPGAGLWLGPDEEIHLPLCQLTVGEKIACCQGNSKMPPSYRYGETILKIDHVSLAFDDNLVLRDVNTEVRDIIREDCTQGQVVGFLGPSGIGKNQLFRIIAGLNAPTSGQVLVDSGTPVAAGMVGVVPQNYPLFEHRTIYSNLLLAAYQSDKNREQAKERVMDYLRRLDMVEQAQLYPAQISGGQRQRVAIVQQLLCSDHFLLMDEPFSGLDPVMTGKASCRER